MSADSDPPELGDVLSFPDAPRDDDRRWIVLFDEDYDNFVRDVDGSVGVLVDQQQAGELLSLTAQTIAQLSPRDATGDDVLRDMIAALEREVDGGE